jgi:hypothetical protein
MQGVRDFDLEIDIRSNATVKNREEGPDLPTITEDTRHHEMLKFRM